MTWSISSGSHVVFIFICIGPEKGTGPFFIHYTSLCPIGIAHASVWCREVLRTRKSLINTTDRSDSGRTTPSDFLWTRRRQTCLPMCKHFPKTHTPYEP
jgi:hypothetical protein